MTFDQGPHQPELSEPRAPIGKWGKDHWSAFAYVECRCVDNRGTLHRPHLRVDADRNPQMADATTQAACRGKKYPTRLKGGELLQDHDDWDCILDLEAEGLVEIHGTGIHPVLKMTPKGSELAGLLREHRAAGGNFSGCSPP